MRGNMLSSVTLNFVLRVVSVCAMNVPLVIKITSVNLDDLATNVASLRIPTHMVTHFERYGHASNAFARLHTLSTVKPKLLNKMEAGADAPK